MKAFFDDVEVKLSFECVAAAVHFGLHYCLSMQESVPDNAGCWVRFAVWIDKDGHPNYCYGATEDLTPKMAFGMGSDREVLVGVFRIENGQAVQVNP